MTEESISASDQDSIENRIKNLESANLVADASRIEKKGTNTVKWLAIGAIGVTFAITLPKALPDIFSVLAGKETTVSINFNAISGWLWTGLGISIGFNVALILLCLYMQRKHQEQFANEHEHTVKLEQGINDSRSSSEMPRLGGTKLEDKP